MKKFKALTAFILSLSLMGSAAAPVCAAYDGSKVQNEEEYEGGSGTEEHDGYTIDNATFAIIFDSFQDLKRVFGDLKKLCENDTTAESNFWNNINYIYVPEFIKDDPEKITEIIVGQYYCRVSFKDGDNIFNMTWYYNGKDNPEYYKDITEHYTAKKEVNGITYYKSPSRDVYDRKGYTYLFEYNKEWFFIPANIDLESIGETPFVKLYLDTHLEDRDGELYYIGDDGKKESGVKEINGQLYYFSPKTFKAVRNKTMKVSGVMYKFNENGVCNGRYTGYIRKSDGTKVFYENGKVSEEKEDS